MNKTFERFYYRTKLTENSNDFRKTWKVFNDLLPSKKSEEERHIVINQDVISDTNIVVNKFNEIFSNVGSDIASSLNTNDDDTNLLKTLSHTAFSFKLVETLCLFR